MADVFSVLAQDHEDVKDVLAELEQGPARASGASRDQLARRKKMTGQLIIEESKHEALEEMYFWPAVREYHAAGNTLADEATGQEQEAKEVLAKLDKLEAGDPGFDTLLAGPCWRAPIPCCPETGVGVPEGAGAPMARPPGGARRPGPVALRTQ